VTYTAWAILWRSDNLLDGESEYFLGMTDHPCRKALFNTRAEARTFITKHFGYLRDRRDLRDEPHGWKMPVPMRVKIHMVPA
jgi:hypothetical protein